MSAQYPSGTVTFLFCDIEGSTRLWERYPVAMQAALARHDDIFHQAIARNQGVIVKGTGDGFHAAFPTARDGLLAALSATQALYQDAWEEIRPEALRSRVALSTGEAESREGDYFGTAVNRAARLMAIGHGGQVLLSATTASLLGDALPDGVTLLDLGEHRMRDLVRPERVFQLVHPSLPSQFPPLNSLEIYPNNLPVQLTSFIGREQEMAEAKHLLEHSRLVTLIGPGGTGKTRLALQTAASFLTQEDDAQFPQGVWLVEFANVMDPGLVVETVAEVFHLRETRGSPALLEILTGYLHAKRLLLLLDNCEHLVEASARLADTLLRSCPGIKILCSSREAFGIPGEMIHRVPSLSFPSFDRASDAPGAVNRASMPADGSQNQVAKLLEYESVRLFVERAASVHPNFSLSMRNAQAVVRICQRLDGIPLALELAAARIQVFTPEQIAARLDDRFRLLTGGNRNALHRQQTLRALIDWSYDLLSPPEQALLRQLSVFSGGWSYAAAERVSGDADVLDYLANLANKSLVIVNEEGEEARYAFLETIRQYARDKLLEAGETAQARDRHLDYYLELSQEAESHFYGLQSLDWIVRMEQEADNIHSAIEWGLESRPEDALALIGNFGFYFLIQVNIREAQRLARAALARLEQLENAGQTLSGRRLAVKARGLIGLGTITLTLGEILESRPILEQAVDLARTVQDPDALFMGLGQLANAYNFLNEPGKAKQSAEEALALARRTGPTWAVVLNLAMLAWAEGKLGHLARRSELLAELETIQLSSTNPILLVTQMMLGLEARAFGDMEHARKFLEQCLAYVSIMRHGTFEGMVRSELAHIERQSGNLAAARLAYSHTIQLWVDLGNHGAIAQQIECIAFIAREEGQYATAARLLGAAERLRKDVNAPMTDYEQVEYDREVASLWAAFPPPALDREWWAGSRLSTEEAVGDAIAYTEKVSV